MGNKKMRPRPGIISMPPKKKVRPPREFISPPAPPSMPMPMAPKAVEKVKQMVPFLPPQVIKEVLPSLPPQVIKEVAPKIPPQVMKEVAPSLPPQVIKEVLPSLPPQVMKEVAPSLPLPIPATRDPVQEAVGKLLGGPPLGPSDRPVGPMIIPGTEELPFKKIPPRIQPRVQRPPSIEEQVAQVLSGPSFPGRQMPKLPQQPMRMPEPVGPVTDTTTMPSMPTTGIASLSDVLPLLDMGGEDIMQLLSDLPKTPPAPVQPPVDPIVEEILKDIIGPTGLKEDPRIKPIKEFIEEERPPMMETPPFAVDPIPNLAPLPPMSLVDAEGNPYVPRHSEQDPITGEVLNNQPFGGETPPFAVDPIPDPITGDRYPQTNDSNPYGFTPPPADSMNTMAMVPYHNPTTGETWMAPSGGWTAPPGWEVAPSQSFLPGEPGEPMVPAPDVGAPAPEPMMPPAPETTPAPEPMMPPAPETTPVQGMTMEQMQQMIADMQAQQQEQAVARAAQEKEMSKQYMVYGDRTGYNPYLSGQYQSDPYGPSGVPNMGGITTIPVPDGYGIYNPVYGG